MTETVVALGLLALLGVAYAAWAFAAVETVLWAGAAVTVTGLAFGVPAGAWYHVELRRSLLRAGALPAGWYWRPLALHDRVPASDRRRVLAWCYLGAAGFGITVLGCGIVALGALRVLQAGP
jgi:hypothetical protein